MSRLLTLALLSVTALALFGCSMPHLAGTNDAALEYAVDADPATGKTLDAQVAATGVKARLSSAQVPADVDVTDGSRVRVVLDADIAGAVDDLVIYRGGMSAYRVDDGGQVPAEHATFTQKVPGGATRTIAVALPPLVELGVAPAAIDSIEPILRGRALAFAFAPDARAAIAQQRTEHPDARIALARGRSLLAVLTMDQALANPLVISFGDDLQHQSGAGLLSRERAVDSDDLHPAGAGHQDLCSG